MDTELEIVCKQDDDWTLVKSEESQTPEQSQSQSQTGTETTQQNIKFTLRNLITKICELTKIDKQSHNTKKQHDDEWEIPFDRIRMSDSDFQRCGSEGEVFYARLSNQPVAVKRVKDAALAKVKHLRELNHKNIIKFKGTSQDSCFHYIIMEWCPYGTLHDHIHSGRQLSATILSDFAHQIAHGMKYLHSKNIIHRDLKPSNILLTHHNVLKISDFGSHKVFKSDKLPSTSISYAGTHAYMAPEVIRSEPYSFPVDVWSYGVVLWEMLIGEKPFNNLDGSAVVWAVGNNSFRLPVPFSFPEGYSRILEGCWSAKSSDRLTFAQICIILKGAIQEAEKISKDRWLPLQSKWKRDVRNELDKQLHLKHNKREDATTDLKRIEVLEDAEKVRIKEDKIIQLYYQLQELCMKIQREAEESARQKKITERVLDERTIQYQQATEVAKHLSLLKDNESSLKESDRDALNQALSILSQLTLSLKTPS